MAFVERSVSSMYQNGRRLGKCKPEDTYISIFGPHQEPSMQFLEKHPDIKIVFKGAKAVNGNRYHGVEGRNTIVVYEYEPKVSL
jgi:hypothetical protein